ncbi:MAG: transporter [Rhodanobacter sp.]
MDFSRYEGSGPKLWRCGPSAKRLVLFFVFLLGGISTTSAWADNPGYDRPGLGFNPASLEAGNVTFEQGLPTWTEDRQDGIRNAQYSADSLLRLGLGHALELQFGDSLYNHLQLSGAGVHQHSTGRGDSNVALKLALPSSNAAFSWGLLGSVEFTDGNRDFRNDQRQYLLGMALGLQLSQADSIGAYLEDVRAGGADSRTMAINGSHALTPTLTIYAETVWQREADSRAGTLAGAGMAWQVSHRVQLDAGFRRRVSGPLPTWWAGLGASMFFGH